MAFVPSQCYKLVDDIGLPYYGDLFEPINTFYGLLDGDGHDVIYSGIDEEDYGVYTGLFRENHEGRGQETGERG